MGHLVELVKALVWPAVVVFLLLRYGRELAGVLRAVAEGRASLKAGPSGIEITQIVQSAANAAVASAAQAKDRPPAEQAAITRDIVHAAQTSLADAKLLAQRRITWVDDKPPNNVLLIQSFRDLGIAVDLAKSTDEAMQIIGSRKPDLVITDMDRPPDNEAGRTLLRQMRDAGYSMPVINYSAFWAQANRGNETKFGFALITTRPSEVYARSLQLLLNPT